VLFGLLWCLPTSGAYIENDHSSISIRLLIISSWFLVFNYGHFLCRFCGIKRGNVGARWLRF